ncbi:MAG: carboxypeptidase regulatory-like domain-containing protein [Terracidiphilus sp.]
MISLARISTQTSRKWRMPAFAAAAIALCMLMFIPNLRAQSGAGSIEGTVSDPTGAVIPDASVNVVNTATNVALGTKTNRVGFYQAPGLFAGTYKVTVTAPGMETYNRTIDLLVSQTATVNATMTAGAVTQQVTVSASAVQLTDTNNGTITSTLENARINQLPMNGRNIITLINETTPGLESCPESGSCANGQEGPSTEYETDGATLTSREFGGVHMGSQQMVDPDALQEVRVEDEGSGAQFASPSTVILNTKSGTNRLHGSMFETARNNAIGVARGRNNPSNYVAPQYVRNEFGASVGGPVVIPHLYHGKDKTFFFFAYERYSLAQSPDQSEKVPTPQMQQGDFSQATNSSNVLQELYDPATTGIYGQGANACAEPTSDGSSSYTNPYCRESFTQEYNEGSGGGPANCNGDTNCIPATQEAALTKTLNTMVPSATGPNGVLYSNISPVAANNYTGTVKELSVEPQITWRLDQVFNENNRAYLRYTQNLTTGYSPRNDPGEASYTLAAKTPGGASIPALASGVSYNPNKVYAAAFGFTHVFSPTFFSETVLSQTWIGEHNYAGGTPNADFEKELGLPNNFGAPGFPEITGNFAEFGGTQFQYSVTTTTYDADENLTKVFGRHQLLFGGRYRFEHFGSVPDEIKDAFEFGDYATAMSDPSKYSSSAASAYSNSGNANADMFLGAAYSYSNNIEPPYQHLHDMELDGYIQDNYHVRNNLTLNLGIRYEAHPAMWEGQGAMMGFDLKNDALVTSGSTSKLISEGLTTQAVITNDMLNGVKFETPAEAGRPPMLVNSYDFTFGPRVGAAWQPFGKWGTVLRGAVGRYIYPVPTREEARLINRNNPFTAGYSRSYTSTTYTPHSNYMMLSAANYSPSFSSGTTTATTGGGWPIMGTNSTSLIDSTSTTAIAPGLGIVSINPDNPPSYVDEANFTVEQPLKWGSVLRVSYLYTHGTNLNNSFYYNDHPSEYSWEIQQGAETPANPGSAVSPYNGRTGEGPYDNLTYGSGNYQIQKSGWSNYNALQAVYQKLYHSGSAWQFMYVWEKNLRTGGDYGGESGDAIDPYSTYVNSYEGNYIGAGANTVTVGPANANSALPGAPNLPPPPPAGTQSWQYYRALNRWENYMVDTNTPPQHIQFNGLIDFPFGRGKRWLSNIDKPLNELVGGWQLAAAGRLLVTDFQITTTNWGPTSKLTQYKKSHLIVDCTSGTCVNEYEWFNGYIAPTAISGNTCSAGFSTVVNKLPSSWAPYQTPLDTSCSAPVGGKTVVDKYYGDNDVAMSGVTGVSYPGAKAQANGTVIGYGVVPSDNDNGASEGAIDVTNPYGHTVLNGPWNWGADATLFKVFPIREGMDLRINVDAFNVFNNQGLANPSGTTGETCVQAGTSVCSSHNTPRQLQISARFNF